MTTRTAFIVPLRSNIPRCSSETAVATSLIFAILSDASSRSSRALAKANHFLAEPAAFGLICIAPTLYPELYPALNFFKAKGANARKGAIRHRLGLQAFANPS